MDNPMITFITIVIIFSFVGGVIFLSYWIPKIWGYKKAGKIIAGVVSVCFLIFFIKVYIDDYLFFKGDALEFLAEQNIDLKDDFEIIEHKQVGTVDYYRRFELLISKPDKQRLIKELTTSVFYQDSISGYLHLPNTQERYIGDTITVNYQTQYEYKSEFYRPNGKGYAPTYRIISIPISESKLIFEEIID